MKKKNYPSLAGKKVAVVGATGGLGGALCRHLASLGAALVLVGRSQTKSQALAKELKSEFPELSVSLVYADLEDIDSVKKAADELMATDVDHLILSSGAYHIPRKTCPSGFDNVFQINFLAPYYLSRLMKPHVEGKGGRIVAVSSLSCAFAKFRSDDPQYLKVKTAARVYGNAKRLLTFALYGLFGDSDSLAVAHPGISPTGITSGYPRVIRALIKYPMKLIFASPERASRCILDAVFRAPGRGKWIGPRVLGIWGGPRVSRVRGYSTDGNSAFLLAEETCDRI